MPVVRAFLTSSFLVAFLSVGCPGQVLPASTHFDGKWWNATSAEEQEGFVYGYLDCHPHKATAAAYVGDYRTWIGVRVRANQQVAPLVERARLELPDAPLYPGGEEYPETHGWLDGGWWGAPSEDRGYLEGFLTCAHQTVTSGRLQRLQADVDSFYAAASDGSEKVAYVVELLLAGRSPSPLRSSHASIK